MTFFGKNNTRSATLHQTFAKIHSLILLFFSPAKLLSLKVCKEFLGRRMQRRIQNPVEHLKMENCRNGYQRLAVNKICKKIHLGCSTEFWMRLWDFQSFMWEKVYNCVNGKVI